MEKLMITVAIVGGITTRDRNPHIPMTPKEIADSAIESYHAGAATCHIHVRDPITYQPSMELKLYKEVFDRIRDNCDMIINLTTSNGASLSVDAEYSWDFSRLKTAEERVEHILKLEPELCSLDVGTMNLGRRGFINLPYVVEQMAGAVKEAGCKPELEVFDPGHIRIAKHLIDQGLVSEPPLFQLCLGIPWGIEASTENLLFMRNGLPPGSLWCAFGPGPHHYTMAAACIINGGHVRVGFEDNLYIKRNVFAKTNAEMVGKVVELAGLLDRPIATAAEARKLLKLRRA